jgi:uncharacterized protein (DUF2235 family)
MPTGEAIHGKKIKRIVVLSDGTGNSAARVWRTNVWRLYQALDLSNGRQVGLYDDGVGSSAFKPLAMLGGVFGWGLKRNVLDLYRFVCRNWQNDAQLYGFGFSRGAFTIRVLMGLIANEGLVPVTSEAQLHRDAVAAYRSYRRRYTTVLGPLLVRPLRALRDAIIGRWNRLLRRPAYDRANNRQVPTIAFLGLWDTVAAYGLPVEEMTRGMNMWLWPLALPDRKLNDKVQRARHALALDDERTTFHPVLWTERGEKARRNVRDERISQVWFAGVHSNVGGGYPDDGLAHVSLHWMMSEAQACGLEFKKGDESIEEVRLASDGDGRLYDSRYGLAGYYRYCPRKVVELSEDTFSRQPDDEVTIKIPKIHESVFHRLRAGARGYAPVGLPAQYAVVDADGNILGGELNPYETPDQAATRAQLQERVWNLVWCRRIVYFATVAASAYLALFPLIHTSPSPADRSSAWSFLSGPIRAAGAVLPGALGEWLEAFGRHPGWFAVWTTIVVALMTVGRRLEFRIGDRMRSLWLTAPATSTWRGDWIYRLRTHRLYRGFFRILKRHVLPTFFAALIVFALFVTLSRGVFAITRSLGFVCAGTPAAQVATGPVAREGFSTDAVCWASGVRLEAGERYRITIEPLGTWKDGAIEVPLDRMGFGFRTRTAMMYAALPLRRWMGEHWFRPIARVGSQGDDEYALMPADSGRHPAATRSVVSEIQARTSGELFLFVNDAVIELPGLRQRFYRNNAGTARIVVEPLTVEPLTPAAR